MIQNLRLFKYAAIIFLLLFFQSNTSAYETCKTSGGINIKWQNPEVTYRINSSGGPLDTIASIQEGMQTWTDVASSEFIFLYGGTTNRKNHGTNNATNIITFGSLPIGTIAENKFWFSTVSGQLVDSDIRFNNYYLWSTDGIPATYDLQNIATHELGHSLCLLDLYDGASSEITMYGYASTGETKKSSLHQDDIAGITYLYTCPNLPVRIEGTSYEYNFLQDAYDDALSNDIILIHSIIFTEDLIIDINKSVIFDGGYNCDHLSPTANPSVINGTVNLIDGAITMENFIIE